MSAIPSVEILVYPDDCDSFGHVNQAAYLRLFEHARWEAVAKGPGMDLFKLRDAWPAVRKATIEYHVSAFAGDLLRIETNPTHLGRTSFSLRNSARRISDGTLVAEADILFVCVNRAGKPTPIPPELIDFFGVEQPAGRNPIHNIEVRGVEVGISVLGDGPTVLLVHGFPLDRSVWRHLTPRLAGWKCVAPDLRGLGGSGTPNDDYSMAAYADDLAALLDSLEISDAVLCGLSMGGYVTFEFMRRHADRVRGLILLNTRADKDTDEIRRRRDEMIDLANAEGMEALAELFVPKLLAPGAIHEKPDVVEWLRSMIAGQKLAGVIGALQAMKTRADSTAMLSGIDVPTLVVTGDEDQMIPAGYSRSMAEAIPGAKYAVIPEAGHLTPIEQPAATGRVVSAFLESLA